ncbi:MAG: thymidine phosphorylase [Gemmatimonadales bacterium]|nr:thymidine phosphorylase [Gemmatimonadales bacterium]
MRADLPPVPALIERKRDGFPLAPGQWRALIEGYTAGRVPDYQLSALCMAVVFRGLDPAELAELTDAMLASGDRLRFDGEPRPRVDKHSTGGVGDKTSLILTPLLAAAGVVVPMMSGRGLGHTGGTLDKLEAIPGFRTNLPLADAVTQARRIGAVMLGQTEEVCPADKRLYALRDVSGTVPAIPLISASIMSKKLAEGLTALVLDVKVGSGAFIPEEVRALELARTMIGLGAARGCPVVALLTAMDRPLGVACGNALEVREALAMLRGEPCPADLVEVTLALGAEMLVAAEGGAGQGPGAGGTRRAERERRAAARARLEALIASGAALDAFRTLVAAQGGDPRVADEPEQVLPRAPVVHEVRAHAGGMICEVAPKPLGLAVVALGGGRSRVEDRIDPAVGIELRARPGDTLARGDLLATIHARTPADAEAAEAAVRAAIRYGDEVVARPLVSHRVTVEGVERL